MAKKLYNIHEILTWTKHLWSESSTQKWVGKGQVVLAKGQEITNKIMKNYFSIEFVCSDEFDSSPSYK